MIFIMSLSSFSLTILPKVYSLVLLIGILCARDKKFKMKPLLGESTKSTMTSQFDDDIRRKTIKRAFILSEFRINAMCVDYIKYEIDQHELLMSITKFLS